jgi:hypothetical protein
VFFHQGAPALGDGALRTDRDLQALRAAGAHRAEDHRRGALDGPAHQVP